MASKFVLGAALLAIAAGANADLSSVGYQQGNAGNPVIDIDEYRIDDGVLENSIGLTAGGSFAWATRFVTGANNTLTGLRVAFGTPVAINGAAVTAYIWSDPNGDGSPADAQVLTSVAGTISGGNASVPINSPTFVTFDFPDITRTPGTNFFAGIVMQNQLASQFPAAIDQTLPLPGPNTTWAGFGAAGGFNPNAWTNVTNINTIPGLEGKWAIRVNAIPAPGALALLGLGALAAGRRRR